MRRTWLLALLAVVAVLVAVPAVGLAVDGAHTNAQDDANEPEVTPGEQLSGVVGAGEAEISGDHEQRSLDAALAQADSDQARADIVSERLGAVEQRLDDLEQRRAALDAQREAGEITEGEYRAELTRLAAQAETAKTLGNRTGQAANGVPTDLLADRGVDADRIQQISSRASDLTGPEVAEIARGIAGNDVGNTPAANRPVDVPRGPPDDDRPRGPPDEDRRGPPGDTDDPTNGDNEDTAE